MAVFDKLDVLDWWTFTCTGCGELTYVGIPVGYDLEQFAEFAAVLYGDPPVCSSCQNEARQ